MNAMMSGGMIGEPIPYSLRSDWMVTTVLFMCMVLVTVVFSKGRKYWLQAIRNLSLNRERGSMFDEVTAADVRHTFLLVAHSFLMLGLCVYYYWVHKNPILLEKVSHSYLLIGFAFSVVVLQFLRWILYQMVNWAFFQKVRNKLWMTAFFHLYMVLGLCFLPVFLLVVYFDVSLQISFWIIGILLFLAKIALFWKCFSNFFAKIYGVLHLILYFCALEILPDLIWWKGMEWMNNNLILNL